MMFINIFYFMQGKTIPQVISDVIEEEMAKLKSLDSHASEFKYDY